MFGEDTYWRGKILNSHDPARFMLVTRGVTEREWRLDLSSLFRMPAPMVKTIELVN